MRKVIIGQEYMIPCFPQNFSFIPKENKIVEKPKKKNEKVFKRGGVYSLRGVECDEFEMPSKEYELITTVRNVNGINLDSVVMKQISGENDTIFSLTKSDCRNLNIEFQKGLQLFPMNMNWMEINKENNETKLVEEKPIINIENSFDPTNLTTYPVCHVDNTIRRIMVELNGFRFDNGRNVIITPYNDEIHHSVFRTKLHVRLKRNLYGNNKTSSKFNIFDQISFRVMTDKVGTCTTNDIVDNNNNIYIELFLEKFTDSTLDDHIGVKPEVFDNQPIFDVFEFYYLIEEPTEKKISKTVKPKVSIKEPYNNEYRWAMPNVDNIINEQMKNIDRMIDSNMTSLEILLKRVREEEKIEKLKRKYGV